MNDSDSSTLEQIGPIDANDRQQELRRHVQFILHNRGLQDLLDALILVLQDNSRGEIYMRRLIADLHNTQANYMERYLSLQDKER